MTRGGPLNIVAVLACLLGLAAAGGCKETGNKVEVHGQVSFRGAPLERAALTFYPATGRAESAAVKDGKYAVGLDPGNYTAVVLISPTLPTGYKEGDKIPPPSVVLPEVYTSRMKSPLKVDVQPGQSDPINFELK